MAVLAVLFSLIVSTAITMQLSDFVTLFIVPWIKYRLALQFNGLKRFPLIPSIQPAGSDQAMAKLSEADGDCQADLWENERQFCMQPPPALAEIFSSKVLVLGFATLFAQVTNTINNTP